MAPRTIFRYLVLLTIAGFYQARAQEGNSWTYNFVNDYRIVPNVVYSTSNNYQSMLDVYMRNKGGTPNPTVIYIHGGGWVAGAKESSIGSILPYLEMGLSVVNVEYRLARVSLAPAAVVDCRLALRWVFKNAKQYGFDTTRIVVTGGSAGGHLALMTGMLTAADGFDVPTDWDYAGVLPKVAAIVNWFGITDVNDLLSGPNEQKYAVYWIGNQENKESMARRVSPLTYVRKGLPPIFTVQGDKDQLVPYTQGVRLHEALDKAGVQNEMLTIPGGRHGGFSKEEMNTIYNAIKVFLKKNRIVN